MSDADFSRVEALLADISNQPRQRGNLIFALDATASRERTWDLSAQLMVRCSLKSRLSARSMCS